MSASTKSKRIKQTKFLIAGVRSWTGYKEKLTKG